MIFETLTKLRPRVDVKLIPGLCRKKGAAMTWTHKLSGCSQTKNRTFAVLAAIMSTAVAAWGSSGLPLTLTSNCPPAGRIREFPRSGLVSDRLLMERLAFLLCFFNEKPTFMEGLLLVTVTSWTEKLLGYDTTNDIMLLWSVYIVGRFFAVGFFGYGVYEQSLG